MLGKGCDITIYDKNINISLLTGTNKEYINTKIPHLASLLTDDPESLIENSDVIIVNTKESEFVRLIEKVDNKVVIDFVRLDEGLLSKSNYQGINW